MDKWKKAIVHLECVTDSEHIDDRIKRIDGLRDKLNKGEILHEEFAEQTGLGFRDIRYNGTAVFMIHNKRRYLITSRHVLWDEDSAIREFQEELNRIQAWPESNRAILIDCIVPRGRNRIFSIIFRVPNLDEVIQGNFQAHEEFLMNLGAGTSSTAPYTFSSPEIDLAVMSLDNRDSRFADELVSKGYEPLSLNNIGEEPSKEGTEVFTVGYPSSTALLGQASQNPAAANWYSSYFSLPTFSFGRVSMLHNVLPFYWVDMSIYPGNSGGPIIEIDKIVGIVSAQPTIPVEESEELRTRIPFGKIIKAKFIAKLLSIQEQKDAKLKRLTKVRGNEASGSQIP